LGCHTPDDNSFLEEEQEVTTKSSNDPFYLGGIHVNVIEMEHWLNTLKDVGMNTVEVTVYGRQWYWNTDYLTFDEDKEVEKRLVEIRTAKEKGLKVVVVLRVQLQHWAKENQALWHGMIMPKTDSLLHSWFERYTAYNLKWAKICEEEGVDVMVIGSEMNALSSTVELTSMPWLYGYYNSWFRMAFNERRIIKYKETLQDKNLWVQGYNINENGEYWLEDYVNSRVSAFQHWGEQVTFKNQENPLQRMNERRKLVKNSWIELIQEVREIYKGKLTYAANYDNYQEVDFWEHLDFIGINAYFPLREPTEEFPSNTEILSEFEENWRNVFKEINAFKKKQHLSNKPLLFTELGYTNYLNATVESWCGHGFTLLGWGLHEKLVVWEEQEKCLEERYLAVEALRKVTESYPTNLQGILYWKLTDYEGHLKEEPFGLYIQTPSKDPLQDALVKFMPKKPINEQNN